MTTTTVPSTDKPASLTDPMGWLFGEIHGLFGNQFLDKFRSGIIVDQKDTGIENMKAVWSAKIRENRMHFGEIKRGLAGCQRLKFPPSWGEFFELCRPPISVDEAIYEACAQLQKRKEGCDNWSHPAIYWAAMKVGHYEMTTLSHSQLRERFGAALREMMAKADLPPVPVQLEALPQPGQGVMSKDQAVAALKRLKASDVLKTTGSTVDHRRWAKRILERVEKGDPLVTPLQARMAREAMSAPEV